MVENKQGFFSKITERLVHISNITSGKQVILSSGAKAKNIFWIVADTTTLETTSVFNGNILDKTNIAM